MNFKKHKKIYSEDELSRENSGWLLTQIGGGFTFWCYLFHTKYHEYKDEYNTMFRKHRCIKCGTVYMSPTDNIINELL